MTICATLLVRTTRDAAVLSVSVPAHPLRFRCHMGRILSAFALALMSLGPLCTTIACSHVVIESNEDPRSNDDPGGNDDDPTNPEQASACEPRQPEISADFELMVEDVEAWPSDGLDSYRYSIAAPCQVEAADATSRDLACTDKDGAVHGLTLAILNPGIMAAVPTSGPVFVRTARYRDWAGGVDQDWFEVRAGSDVAGALLVGGVRADRAAPFAPVDGYFAPIWMALTTEEGCREEIRDECMSSRRARLSFWVDEVPVASILDGHEGYIEASGAYRAVVGASVESLGNDLRSCWGDHPHDFNGLRVLIGASVLDGP